MGRKRSTETNVMTSLRGLGIDDVLDATARVFESIEIAEQETRKAQDAWPERKDLLHGAFMLLKPPDAFSGKDSRLYRHHCAELLGRVAKKTSITPNTKAEIMLILSELSLVTPIGHDYAVLYGELFGEIMGQNIVGRDMVGTETYQGATAEILDELRKHKNLVYKRVHNSSENS